MTSDETPAVVATLMSWQEKCLDAALTASVIVTILARKKHLTRTYWFAAYITFCAATVMLVFVAQNESDDRRGMILAAAERCLEIEKLLAGEGQNKMARRYATALEVRSLNIREGVHADLTAIGTFSSSKSPSQKREYSRRGRSQHITRRIV
jgi:hypothetical protein